jgi:hypothetical protein
MAGKLCSYGLLWTRHTYTYILPPCFAIPCVGTAVNTGIGLASMHVLQS